MPLNYYNQLNKKTAQENYNKIILNRQKKNESFFITVIKNSLKPTVEQALNEIFKSFKI